MAQPQSIEEELLESLYRGFKRTARIVRSTFRGLRRLLRRGRARQPVGAPAIDGPGNFPPNDGPEQGNGLDFERQNERLQQRERELDYKERRAMTEAVVEYMRNNPEAKAQLQNLSPHQQRMLLLGLVERAMSDEDLARDDVDDRLELEQGADGPDRDPLDVDGNRVLDTRDRDLRDQDVDRLTDGDGDRVPDTVERDREAAERDQAEGETTEAEQNAEELEREAAEREDTRETEAQEQDGERERLEGSDALPAAAAGAAVAEGLDGQDQPESEPAGQAADQPAVDAQAEADRGGQDVDQPVVDGQAEADRDGREGDQPAVDAQADRDGTEADQPAVDAPAEADQVQPVVDEQTADQGDRAEGDPGVERGEVARDDVEVDRAEPVTAQEQVDREADREPPEVDQAEPAVEEQAADREPQVEPDREPQAEVDQDLRAETERETQEADQQRDPQEIDQAEPDREPQEVELGDVARDDVQVEREQPEMNQAGVDERDRLEQDRQGPEAEQNQQEPVEVETSTLPTGGDLHAEAQAREAQKPSGPLEARLDADRDRENALRSGEQAQGQQGYSQPMSDTEKAKLDALAHEGVAGPAERRPDRELQPAGQGGRTPGAQHQRDTQRTQDPEDQDRTR